MPGSLESLAICLKRLVNLRFHDETSEFTGENEMLQYFIYSKQISVEVISNGIEYIGVNKIGESHLTPEMKSLQETLKRGPFFFPVGVIWFAGENHWPYIGYLPEVNKILFTERFWAKEDNPSVWINQAIEPNDFSKGIERFLNNFEDKKFRQITENISESLALII